MDGRGMLLSLADDIDPGASLYKLLKWGVEDDYGAEPGGKTLRDELLEIADQLGREAADDESRRSELCSILCIDACTGWGDACEEMRSRLMPIGCEWPRYEDGEPVRIGDTVRLYDGSEEELRQVHLARAWYSIYTDTHDEWYRYGERVKRPQVLAADGVPLARARPDVAALVGIAEGLEGLGDDVPVAFRDFVADIARRIREALG